MYITAIIIACIALLFIAFFISMQTAFIYANRLNIELKKKQGSSAGGIMSHFVDEPSQFVSVCLSGSIIFLVIYGLMVGTTLSPLWDWLNIDLPYITLSIEIILSTLIILLLGEWLPKAIGKTKADGVLLNPLLSRIIASFDKLFTPLIMLFVSLSKWISDILFNIRIQNKKEIFVATDVEHFGEQSKDLNEEGQELNEELFENALLLPNIKIRQCLVPRKEIEAISLQTSINAARQHFIDTKLSKLVVYENSIDNIVGYIHQLDLFKNPTDIKSILHAIPAVPESMSAIDLITKFSTSHKSIAWVVDEFGGTAGIVTMEDVLEEIFGEIQDEYDTEEFTEKKIGEKEFIFSGRLELDYLKEKYDVVFEKPESETLSGYIINHHEKIPQQKERIIIDDYEFEILSVSDTRIEMVKMKILK